MLNKSRDAAGKAVKKQLTRSNNFDAMVSAGSKGNTTNICQSEFFSRFGWPAVLAACELFVRAYPVPLTGLCVLSNLIISPSLRAVLLFASQLSRAWASRT